MDVVRIRIRDGYADAGKTGVMLGVESFMVGGQHWTPVHFDDESEPDFHKTASLEYLKMQWIPLTTVVKNRA